MAAGILARSRESLSALETDVRKEKIENVGQTIERLEKCLCTITKLRQDHPEPAYLGRNDHSESIGEKLRQLEQSCAEAASLPYALLIQREATGLLHHEEVDRQYSRPESLADSFQRHS